MTLERIYGLPRTYYFFRSSTALIKLHHFGYANPTYEEKQNFQNVSGKHAHGLPQKDRQSKQ